MSCSMIAAEIPMERTTEVTVSMIGAFSRGLTPLVGSSTQRSLGWRAPFEPISASTSRCLTVKFTWSTAWVSPKYLTSSLVTRRLTSASLLPARGEPLRGPDDPGGQRDHERHQHGPEEELPVHRVPDGVGLEVVEHDRADDGARERPEAAEHGH